MFVDGSRQPPLQCDFYFMNKSEDILRQTSEDIHLIAVSVSLSVVITISAVIIFLLVCRRYKISCCWCLSASCLTDESQEPRRKRRSEEQENFLNENPDGKLWYWPDILPKEEERLLDFDRNRVEGSFLIRRCRNVPTFYYLSVLCEGTLNRFRLRASKEGIFFLDTAVSFDTLTELVVHHRKYDIVSEDGAGYGRLTKPFEKVPEDAWYAGKMERADQYRILQSEVNGPGSFLIREGITKSNSYSLVVNVQGEVREYRISVEDDGYEFCDADNEKLFPTLSALVKHYSENNIILVHGDNLGRLCKPAKGILQRKKEIR